ncbi:DUF1990 domain-containing protein [Embleya sp. NBC_00896]|uniref:DUF1990 family protein n=1 Tax=Embleya sp. NBC_00896 TaxID=2975961 RepID=UPI002F91354C|nr:DUF1990 domain-containing protein [Embleya sp. NBC_00896]
MSAPLTYTEIGATVDAGAALPHGYHHVERRVRVGDGDVVFRALADGILSWAIQRGAGLTIKVSAERAALDVDITSVVRLGFVPIAAPCRVVRVIDEPDRIGFAYGTLRGHPEHGEEAFLVERDAQGEVWFVVRAFSRPGVWWSRLGGPVARLVQRRITDRYVRAAHESAARA